MAAIAPYYKNWRTSFWLLFREPKNPGRVLLLSKFDIRQSRPRETSMEI